MEKRGHQGGQKWTSGLERRIARNARYVFCARILAERQEKDRPGGMTRLRVPELSAVICLLTEGSSLHRKGSRHRGI